MLALPSVAPLVGFVARGRSPRDFHDHSEDYCEYRVRIGRMVEVPIDLAQAAVILKDRIFASPNRPGKDRGQTITDRAQAAAAATLRLAF